MFHLGQVHQFSDAAVMLGSSSASAWALVAPSTPGTPQRDHPPGNDEKQGFENEIDSKDFEIFKMI